MMVIKYLNQFFQRKDLAVVLRAPAKQRDKVDDRF